MEHLSVRAYVREPFETLAYGGALCRLDKTTGRLGVINFHVSFAPMTGQGLKSGPGKSRRRERRLAGRELLENRAERSITAERCLLRREENKASRLSRAICVS